MPTDHGWNEYWASNYPSTKPVLLIKSYGPVNLMQWTDINHVYQKEWVLGKKATNVLAVKLKLTIPYLVIKDERK